VRLTWTILLGAALGCAASAADAQAGGLGQTDAWRAVGMLLNAGSVWAGLALLAGWLLRTPARGAIGGVLALVTASVAYYAFGVLAGDRGAISVDSLARDAGRWLVVALVLGPALGTIGALIRRPSVTGLLAALVLPVGVAAEMVVVRGLDGRTFNVDPWLAWTQTGMLLAALVPVALTMTRSRPAALSPA